MHKNKKKRGADLPNTKIQPPPRTYPTPSNMKIQALQEIYSKPHIQNQGTIMKIQITCMKHSSNKTKKTHGSNTIHIAPQIKTSNQTRDGRRVKPSKRHLD